MQTLSGSRSLPPGPRGIPVLGVLPNLLRDPVQFCAQAALVGEGIVHLNLGLASAYLVTHPEYLKYILVDHNRNYSKGNITKRAQFLLGLGLITSDGELWRTQRHLMQPAFHRKRIENLGTLMVGAVERLLEHWETSLKPGTTLDLSAEMSHLTMDIIIQSLFSTSVSYDDARRVSQAFTIAFQHVNTRLFTFFLPDSWPLPGQKRAEAALAQIDSVVYRVIEERRKGQAEMHDLLAMLLEAQPDEQDAMSDKQLHDEIVTMFGAGHETSAAALTWTWYLLDQHRDIEQRLHTELATVLAGRIPTINDLPQLPYTRMVIEESMRIYPPVWIYFRTPIEDDNIGGYPIPAGAPIFLSPYATHHDPRLWPEPERFDPERFSQINTDQRQRYAYFPFSGGQRACIGQHMAMIEAQLTLATIAQRYIFRLAAGQHVVPQTASTLQPKNGLQMIPMAR